jgi:hypothetical protein
MEQPTSGVIRRFRLEPQHNIDRLLLEYPERQRRIGREIEVLAARKPAIEQINGDDPLQAPQAHLRQFVHMRNQPPPSPIILSPG